jgi:hypothetical protein
MPHPEYRCPVKFFPPVTHNVIAKRRLSLPKLLPLKQSLGSQILLIDRETASAKIASQ